MLTGPARFWDPWRIRIVLLITLAFSLASHIAFSPWRFLPDRSGIEFKDVDAELSIPVDLLGEEQPPPEEKPPPEEPKSTSKEDEGPNAKSDAGPKKKKDAGTDDTETDAGTPLATKDAGTRLADDGGASDGGDIAQGGTTLTDGGLVASADASAAPGAGGPRDPESMFGMQKAVNAGPQNVVLGINNAVIRKNPVGARMGPVLQHIPQWQDFLKGSQSAVDPIRDTDWILIYGPSLRHTDRCAVLVRYNVADDAVDQTIDGIAKASDKGGPFDAGVPGVKGSLGHADNAQRVFLRPQSKLLVIVPPTHAREAAATYKRQVPRGPSANEAMRLIVRNPGNQISIPNLKFSSSLTELRLWIIPRSDGGADVYAEGDTTDESAAADSADALNDLIKRQNSVGVRIATRGLLNNANVVAEGKHLKLHVQATQEQLEAVLNAVAAFLGANVPPSSGGGPAGGGQQR